jgi:hypothetical protein
MSVPHSQFRDAVLDAAQPCPAGLVAPGGRPAGARFDVYRNNVIVGLMDALEVAFPVLARIIGPGTFRNLARLHAAQHPPRSPLMMQYGADMPAFLDGFAPLAHLGYLPDVACLELALRAAYHAPDADAVSDERLRTLSPDRLMAARVTLAPSMRVIKSDWPVASIWAFNMVEDAEKPVMRAEEVLIARPGFDPSPHVLPTGGAAFLAALRDGSSMAEACATVDEADLAVLFATCLSTGIFIDIHEAP